MPCHAMVLLGLAHLCRPQAESTRIETNIPGNDFVAPYGFEMRSNFVKARKGKRYEDILCNATHSVWEEENRQSMNLCSKKVCAEQQLYHGGWEQESINGSWMGPLLLDPELSFSPERRSAFTFFSHSFVDHWWWITLPTSLSGWGWWPILSSCDHVCSVTSPPTYVETKSCLTDDGRIKQIISVWGPLIL